MEEQHRVLVLDVAMDKTTFSIYELGYEQELQSIEEELPRETDPFRPGKEERHRLTHVKWHFKATAQLADRLFKERSCDLVMLIGEETVVKEFEDYLPKALQDRLLARTCCPSRTDQIAGAPPSRTRLPNSERRKRRLPSISSASTRGTAVWPPGWSW